MTATLAPAAPAAPGARPVAPCGGAGGPITRTVSSPCGGLRVTLDGAWVYRAGECRFCGGGPGPVRWRIARLRTHQTVAVGFGVRGAPTRFAALREVRLRLPGMTIRNGSSATPGTGDASPRARYAGDSYAWISTASFRRLAGPDLGGFGDEVLAVVGDPAVRQVCPELTLRFERDAVTWRPGCWPVRSG